ncbi:MAG: alanine--tRNA ligase, partial [Oscillospiraceae bacterium]|nr:alanine--tRNA ligase [Oscillospiraceae bacterium]
MEKYGLNELRERFLSFFESKGHLRLSSFSLVPQGDKSLLLINSGMAPMKPWFTGEAEPPRRRVCTCQKCIRTGDIENVGKTARHGTYFEMLGNFSFGDYFKEDAIAWCWEFLTDNLGMDPQLLYPSVYIDDDEAFAIWRDKVGIAPERITRLGKADNFWEHGAGPCGPCSEVYYDRGPGSGCGKPDCAPGCDCDRYIEIWNNVFTQFNNDGNNNYTELTNKNIDTGMGLERLAVVCQGVGSLFETDTIRETVDKASELAGTVYGSDEKADASLRIITDHMRSAVMMACDGVLPSNEGRGYVLRRLIRRAARHGRLLGVEGLFLGEIAQTVIKANEGAYPETRERERHIKTVVAAEEESFAKTIGAGMGMLAELAARARADGAGVFSGADAFKLYDTYGFPLDLTAEIVGEQGMAVDTGEYEKLMDVQRARARSARASKGDLAWADADLPADVAPTLFTGYGKHSDDARVLAIVSQGEACSYINVGGEGVVVLDRTPFYAEMGGQTFDTGELRSGGGAFEVRDVQKDKGGRYLHHGVVVSGELRAGLAVTASIDTQRRRAVMRAHSATHLLQKALRVVLGEHVNQAGSLVEPDRLRFDFSHFSAMTPEELSRVEAMVNDAILDGLDIGTEEMTPAEAREKGATALFGEKYGDTVRVVSMGDFSVELCGGTHLDNTAKAGQFHITGEFSVASGVRRIEAVTGKAALSAAAGEREVLAGVASALKLGGADEAERRAAQIAAELRELRREVESYAAREAGGEGARILAGARDVRGI